jgi:hypothetical protein
LRRDVLRHAAAGELAKTTEAARSDDDGRRVDLVGDVGDPLPGRRLLSRLGPAPPPRELPFRDARLDLSVATHIARSVVSISALLL